MPQIVEAARQMQISPAAQALLAEIQAPAPAVHALLRGQAASDALALALRLAPRPYVVAWLCQCVRRHALQADDSEGLRLAQLWVQQPDDASRRVALAYAENADYRSVGAWLAAAAGWADGSPVAHDDAPAAAEHLTATAALAALLQLAARTPDVFDATLADWAAEVARLLLPHGQEHAA
ncbi:DUF6931 family protein [Xanthomonas translucens]|uniref:Uncharacterized protein n=5 Tax=Xanthomonas campestris pv. translucens TaxID=343 RepID=A0A109HJH0_XANCT|nr:hypothetical protein [Xanthomonas translucens]KTF40201.1 hypothetical protein OZ12_08120 [Xanthomonas translucens pv. translucens]KWV13302.1 hypothetical protein ATB53_15985 [Xanthomonas translucens]MCS3359036.1 hypothetical protein [Xanthomonas translucens pv. translucens]MCS3372413.1 hypothetical protein [Xanthomonas translucens pv. translucens]MCT8274036.1 hypothetical protein [Xanthomonas translucens pv. translucens]